jgi:AraC-like DNA-binding protein
MLINSPPNCPPPGLKLFYARPPLGSEQIEVNGLGCREWMSAGHVDRPRGTDDWLLMAFHQPVDIGIEQRRERTAGPALLLWQPLAPHFYGRTDQPWCHSWMHLAGPVVEQLIRITGLPVDRPINGVELGEVERCVVGLHEENATSRPDAVVAESLLRILLHQTARRALGGTAAIPPGLMAARQRLEERFAAPVRLAELARLAGLSVNHFCTAFHQAFSLSPYDFVLRQRIEHARVLLRDRNRSIADVAAEVGYDDPASFARLVRRRLGCGPSALR